MVHQSRAKLSACQGCRTFAQTGNAAKLDLLVSRPHQNSCTWRKVTGKHCCCCFTHVKTSAWFMIMIVSVAIMTCQEHKCIHSRQRFLLLMHSPSLPRSKALLIESHIKATLPELVAQHANSVPMFQTSPVLYQKIGTHNRTRHRMLVFRPKNVWG